MQKVIFTDHDENTTEHFEGIEKFDCVTCSFEKGERAVRWCTILPISPKEYRAKHPTGAQVLWGVSDGWTTFEIYADGWPSWGHYTVKIHNSLENEIKAAIQSAFDNGLTHQGL